MTAIATLPTRAQQLEGIANGLPGAKRVRTDEAWWSVPCPICALHDPGHQPVSVEARDGMLVLKRCIICDSEPADLARAWGLPAHALEPSAKPKIAPVWLEDFLLEEIPPPRWLLAPYIQAESVVVMFSAPNVGKTLMAFWAMCQMAMHGKVLALEAEGSRGAFQRRLGRAAMGVGGVPSKRFATLHCEVLSLLDPRHEAAMAAWARGFDCTMLDSLGMFTAGVDENDPVGMSQVGAALKRLRSGSGGTIFGLHHSIKTAWKPGETPSLSQLRGHSALAGMVDTALALVPADAPDGHVAFDVHVVKQRDEEKVKPRRYTVLMRGDTATVEVEELGGSRSSELRAEILAAVPEFPGTATRNDVCDRVPGRRQVKLKQIAEMVDEGVLREVGRNGLQRVVP